MSEPPPVSKNESEEQTEIDLNTNIDLSPAKDQQEPKQIGEDMFFSTVSDPVDMNSSQTQKNEDMDEIFRLNKPVQNIDLNQPEQDEDEDDDDDPFSFSNKSPKQQAQVKLEPVIKPALTIEAEPEPEQKPAPVQSLSLFQTNTEEDEEERDKFIDITLSDPSKIGDGMGSYMVYKITIKTNIPVFKSQEFSTQRRFSDFLNLYEKLKEKHLPAGRILPPAPEKDMIGMAKVKMSKEDQTPVDFIEKRRAALQRFLNRLAKHKTFRYDPDFRDFLEISDELPKATNTSALSGANMLKMFKNVTDSVSKIALKMEETDQWFEEKSRQVENLYVQYKKMHAAAELLFGWRKDLAHSTKDFAKHTSILANSEEQLSLSRALSHLGEVYEKIDQIYLEQSNSDYFILSEMIKDYVCLFDNIKEVFYQRIKTFSNWQKAEEALKSKKDSKAKLEATNKLDKIPTVLAEIKDLETKVEKCKEDFEQISKTIKEEVKRFDLNRANEFRKELTKYLETILNNQEAILKIWDQYLPEVKAI